MGRKELADKSMEAYAENGKRVGEIIEELMMLVPPEKRQEAEDLGVELEQRMFFADYLCDVHGSTAGMKIIKKPIFDYDVFARSMAVRLRMFQ